MYRARSNPGSEHLDPKEAPPDGYLEDELATSSLLSYLGICRVYHGRALRTDVLSSVSIC